MNPIVPEDGREERLRALREEAAAKGTVRATGIRPLASPMPAASPETGYYGQPLLKEPQWTPLVPLYFFVGGATGSLGVIGSLADLLGGDQELARKARGLALAGTGLSTALLIADLGKPSRFLNMLRVFKPHSPMSVGSWVLSGFGASAAASSLADLLESDAGANGFASFLRGAGRTGCVLFGMPLHNYTGVLIGASVDIPAWNNRIRSLPREFGMSGLQSAVSLLELGSGELDLSGAECAWLGERGDSSRGKRDRPAAHQGARVAPRQERLERASGSPGWNLIRPGAHRSTRGVVVCQRQQATAPAGCPVRHCGFIAYALRMGACRDGIVPRLEGPAEHRRGH